MACVVCELRVQQPNKCEPEQAQIVQLDNSSMHKPGHNQVSNSSEDVTSEGSGAGCPDRVPELEAEIAALHKELHSSALNLEKLQHQHSIPKLPWDAMWTLKEKLGEGASGTVYRANNACFPNCVVKKGLLAAIRRETETLCFLHHPNIVRMYAKLDIDEEDEQGRALGCLALQRLGPSLADLLEDPDQTFGLQQLVVGFQGLAAGLAHIHSKGLVDQDVHAGNVLLAMDGSAFVKADLGSAAPVELAGRPNRRYASMCCVGTEAPEIAHSILEHNWYEPNPISDVWALGLLMLTLMGAAGPAAHAELPGRQEYKDDLRDNKSPKESAAIKEYFEYLQQLLPSHGQTSFVQQEATYLLTGLRFQQKPIVYKSQQKDSQTGDHEHPACTRCQHHITDLLQRYGNKMTALQAEKEGLASQLHDVSGQLQDSIAAAIFMQNRLEGDVQQLETAFTLEVSAHQALKESMCKKDEEVQALHIKLASAQDAQATMQRRLEQEQAQVTELQQARLQDSAECQALKDSMAASMHQQAVDLQALHVSLAAAQDAQMTVQQRLEEEQARVALLEKARQQDSLHNEEQEAAHQAEVAKLNRLASDAAAELKKQQEENQVEVADMQAKHEAKVCEVMRQAQQAVSEAAAKHDAKVAALQQQADQADLEATETLQEQQESHQEEIVTLVKDHHKATAQAAAKLQEQQKTHEAKVADQQSKHEAKVATLQRQADQAASEAAAQHEATLAELRQAEQAGREATSALQEQQESHQEEIVNLVKEHHKATSQAAAKVQEQQKLHKEELASLTQQHQQATSDADAKSQGCHVSASSKQNKVLGPLSPESICDLRAKVSDSSEDVTPEESDAGCSDRVRELEAELDTVYKQLDSSALELEELQRHTSIPKLPWDDMWTLKQKLGQGASGTVYRANNACFPNCVLKKGPLAAIQQEAEALRFLSHPNIVQVYAELDIDEEDEQGRALGCLALQRLGPSLAFLLEDPDQTFGLQQLVVGFQGLAAGLAHMHSKGLVDQDVHTGNVLLAMDNSALIKADMGSAEFIEEDGQPNRQYISMCCIGTEAPEIADGILEHGWYEPNPISDVWALGLLMLTLMGAARPAAQTKLHRRKEYQDDMRDHLGPDESAAVKEYFEYLQQLLPSHGQTSFVQQIAFPELFIGGPKTSVARQLRHVAEMCLRADPTKRPTASKVAAALHKIMRQQGWSDDLAEVHI